MTAWKGRTLEQQTAYMRKTYAAAPIRTLEGRIFHEQTASDIAYASEQFDAWLADVVRTSIHLPPKGEAHA